MDAIYNFSFHYTTESTLLTFKAPFIRDKEWDNPLLHAKAGWADWVAQHCQTKHSTGNTLEPLRTWQDWDGE